MVALTAKNLADMCSLIQLIAKKLESILHPLVRQHRDQFLQDQQRLGSQIVVLDVPLLYETGGDGLCDYVIVVYAGEETIRHRALSRPGMTVEKLSGILATQMPASEKCQRADFVLDTDLDPDITRQHLFTCRSERELQNPERESYSGRDQKGESSS
jgi:dephospho-CoA kinase